ncbi:DUF4190 domain-containing protein [Mycobacterium sp. M1]|uniref:DUF4190 domain-containing protein n=1 Tax=Mycolicibacter acidiphilus TaxID=2835306 RepID=A0ABS5RJ94_9MYCO|nr:DUF4190 domain-containing protein [Mycolicibacter acidiphilus]MBS9534269.1 DUF4190 domain-containing protein [Mycolicibacter acidiphilus]
MPQYGTPPLPPAPPQPWPLYPYPTPYSGYGSPSQYTAPRNGLGIAALGVAVAGLLTALTIIGGIALGVVAILLGFAGLARVRRGEANNGGVAIAGMVLGLLAVVAGIGCIFIYIGIFRTAGAGDYMDCMTKAGSDPAAQQRCTDQLREHFERTFGGTGGPSVQESDLPGVPA